VFNSIIEKYLNDVELKQVDVKAMKDELQATMWSGVGIFRNEQIMQSAQENIAKLLKEFNREDKCLSKDEYELRNMLITAELIVRSALNRKESRGAHYRVDYLNTNEVCEHSLIVKNKGEINFVK
jgi:L-aspartate oxidase